MFPCTFGSLSERYFDERYFNMQQHYHKKYPDKIYCDESEYINKNKIISKLKCVDNINVLDLNDYRKYKYVCLFDQDIEQIINIYGGNIVKLRCENNELQIVNKLPLKLKTFICTKNLLTSLDNLPRNLINLICDRNKIQNLNNLPLKLKYLNCADNLICNLDYLPNGLIYLDCSKNNIKYISNLPDSLEILICNENPLMYIDYLPKNLKIIHYSNINVNSLLNVLPLSIESIYVNYSKQPMINNDDNIDLTNFVNLKKITIDSYCFMEIKFPSSIETIVIIESSFKKINLTNPYRIDVKLMGYDKKFTSHLIQNEIPSESLHNEDILNSSPIKIFLEKCDKKSITDFIKLFHKIDFHYENPYGVFVVLELLHH